MTTCLEKLAMSENLTAVRQMSRIIVGVYSVLNIIILDRALLHSYPHHSQ